MPAFDLEKISKERKTTVDVKGTIWWADTTEKDVILISNGFNEEK